jgi:phage baseplate assembly protein gpV
MMNHLINQMMQRMGAQAAGTFTARMGTVSAYDPGTYAIKAVIEPEGVETGFMPLLSPWVGANWGAFFAPEIGAQVLILFQEGSSQVPIAALFAFSTAMPPVSVPSGEMLLKHQSGSLLHFDSGGNVIVTANAAMTLNAPAGCTVNANMTINGNVQTNGNMLASQDISDQNGAHGTIGALRSAYNGHTHGGVQSGGSNTSTPSTIL